MKARIIKKRVANNYIYLQKTNHYKGWYLRRIKNNGSFYVMDVSDSSEGSIWVPQGKIYLTNNLTLEDYLRTNDFEIISEAQARKDYPKCFKG